MNKHSGTVLDYWINKNELCLSTRKKQYKIMIISTHIKSNFKQIYAAFKNFEIKPTFSFLYNIQNKKANMFITYWVSKKKKRQKTVKKHVEFLQQTLKIIKNVKEEKDLEKEYRDFYHIGDLISLKFIFSNQENILKIENRNRKKEYYLKTFKINADETKPITLIIDLLLAYFNNRKTQSFLLFQSHNIEDWSAILIAIGRDEEELSMFNHYCKKLKIEKNINEIGINKKIIKKLILKEKFLKEDLIKFNNFFSKIFSKEKERTKKEKKEEENDIIKTVKQTCFPKQTVKEIEDGFLIPKTKILIKQIKNTSLKEVYNILEDYYKKLEKIILIIQNENFLKTLLEKTSITKLKKLKIFLMNDKESIISELKEETILQY